MEKFEPISLEEINELIPQYSDKADVIADKYKINLRKQIIELSNEFADAYEIDSALENKDNKHQKYCLVFNPAYPVQIEFMNFVYRNGLVYFPEIYALAVTFISQYKQERLVVILERITTKSLAQHLAESRNFSVDFIKKTILIPMYKFLSILEKNNLSYGCINPDNIFLDSNNELIFNERFSTPPGYNQYCLFETTGRAMVEKKFLKGEAKITDDFYALGVLILVLFSGNNKFYDVDTKIIISGKLQSNSYSYVLSLLPKLEISSDINDLLIGLLMDKLSDRWGAYKLFEWIKGKQYNLMVPSDKIDSPRSINFNGTKFFNREALAYELYINWNKAKKFLRDESLIKWIESSIGNVPLANSIKEIKKDTFKTMSNLAFDWSDYTVCRIIAALDPDGPLRIHHLSINLNAVGFALAYYYSNNNSDYVWLISSIIKTELLSEIFMNRSKNRQLEQNNRYFAWQMVFEKCIEYIKNDNCGFGIERCIYELNPALPCKSTMWWLKTPATGR
ncbi:MAG: serine/threonine-protein kinase [Pseudomonadota bacterium]